MSELTLDCVPKSSNPIDVEVDIEVLRAVPQPFSVESESSANWLVKKVVAARQYADRVKVWAEQEVRRAEREEQTLMFLFGRQVEAWVRAEVARLGGRRKSICLPAGTVGFRTVASKLVIDDEQLVLAWAKSALPEAVLVVEKISKAAINTYAEMTGVIPDAGVHIEPQAERFFLR